MSYQKNVLFYLILILGVSTHSFAQDLIVNANKFQTYTYSRSLTHNEAVEKDSVNYLKYGEVKTEFKLYFASSLCIQTINGKLYRRLTILNQNLLTSPFQALMSDGTDTIELIVTEYSEPSKYNPVILRKYKDKYFDGVFYPLSIVDFVFIRKIFERLQPISDQVPDFSKSF